MRKLAGLTIASLCTIAIGGIASAATPEAHPAGPGPNAQIIIDKELPDEFDAELPAAWAFRVDQFGCDGNNIFGTPGSVDTIIVTVDAEGGSSDPLGVFVGVENRCSFRIIELAVDGWEPVSPASGVAEVSPERGETVRAVFSNRPVPPPEVTTPTTEPEATTTTVAATTTTVADTTTTVAATTTAAPTTAPPTTAGTVAPELPATGTSNALTGLLAGLLVLGGLGAVLASRRS